MEALLINLSTACAADRGPSAVGARVPKWLGASSRCSCLSNFINISPNPSIMPSCLLFSTLRLGRSNARVKRWATARPPPSQPRRHSYRRHHGLSHHAPATHSHRSQQSSSCSAAKRGSDRPGTNEIEGRYAGALFHAQLRAASSLAGGVEGWRGLLVTD